MEGNEFMYYTSDDSEHQGMEAIFEGMIREASVIDLYARLSQMAPNEQHYNNILEMMEHKRSQLNQFTNLYMSLTGMQPQYEVEQISFNNYQDGLQRAYQEETEGFDQYQRGFQQNQDPFVQQVFSAAHFEKQDCATRLSVLHDDVERKEKDYGGQPYVVDIEKATVKNKTFRTAVWTGDHLQVTLMSIQPGDDIGLELHPDVDQFLRIEQGEGRVQMGDSKDNLTYERKVSDDFAVMVPAGKWHNLTNTGDKPLKLYSIYAPPEHPFGTVHKTKKEAMAAEEEY